MNAPLLLNVPERVRLRVADFLVLDAAGAFDAIHKTELIDGEVIGVNAQYRPHSYAKSELAAAVRNTLAAISSPLGVLVEAAVELAPHDLPEPDIVVTSEPRGEGFVPGATVALAIEVADTTLGFDLRRKAALYARHRIPEYWVADLNGARIVRMWQPGPDGYAEHDATPFGPPVAAVTIAGLVVATDRLA